MLKLKFEERMQNEDKHLNFHLHITLCLPESVHKNQVVAEKTLAKNVHMCYIGLTEENLKKKTK